MKWTGSLLWPGFITLVDHTGQSVAKDDALSRSEFSARYVSPFLQSSRYTMRIPRDTPSQVVWPRLGLYDTNARQLLPVTDAGSRGLGGVFPPPPIKIVGARTSNTPQHRLSLELGDVATLLTIDNNATPDLYSLLVGLYDQATGARIPITDQSGRRFPGDAAVLAQIEVKK